MIRKRKILKCKGDKLEITSEECKPLETPKIRKDFDEIWIFDDIERYVIIFYIT